MWKDPKTQKGQSLIEAVVTLAVALVIISSVVTLVNASNRRSNISRQATQASKLAQQGMEIVRNIRDVSHQETVRVGQNAAGFCDAAPFCGWSELYEAKQGTDVEAHLESSCVGSHWCLLAGAPGAAHSEANLLNGMFTRIVIIDDDDDLFIDTSDPPDGPDTWVVCSSSGLGWERTKRVTVTVEWDSPTGRSSRTVISCFSSWR